MKKFLANKLVVFIALFVFTLLFYFDAFKHFFYQDDIWHFYISNASSIKDFLDFFNPINKFDYQVYRPLSTQVLFFFFQKIFGINHCIFQLTVMLLLSVNAFLIYKILKKYTKSSIAFLLSIFYIVHHQNIGIIYYVSTIQLSIALLFTLLAIKEIQEKRKNWQIKIWIFYVLSLFSQEIAISNSVIFVLMIIMENKNNLKRYKKLIISLLLTSVAFLSFRFYFINNQLFANNHYQISLNPKTIINNLFWYSAWVMSVPEYVVNFVGSGFKPLPPLFGQYRQESIVSTMILAINFVSFIFLFIKSQNKKKALLYLTCFGIALSPVLIFPWHKYVYHLPIASVFVLIFIAVTAAKLKKKSLALFIISLLIVSAVVSNFIDRKTSYNYKRGVMAQNIKNNIDWSVLKSGQKTLFIANDPTFEVFSKDWGSTSSQAKIVLRDNLFFTVLSGNKKINTIYEDDLDPQEKINYDYKIVIKKEW